MTARRLGTLALLSGGLAWLVSAAWAPFVTHPHTYLSAGAVGILIVALVGLVLRVANVATPAVLVLQLALAGAWLQWHFADLGPLWRTIRAGARATNTHEAPVPPEILSTAPFLATSAVLLAIGLDLLVVGFLRTAIIGLPLLLALTIPVSTLDARLPLPLLLGILALFAALLALEHRWASDDWGRASGSRPVLTQAALITGLATGAAVLGLTAAAVLPTGSGLNLKGDDGRGAGRVDVSNPMVDVRRGLVNQSHLNMLTATTTRRAPEYLRLAVLDHFENGRWTPSARELPRQNRVRSGVPEMPGLRATVPGNTETYELNYSEAFSSRWLATPYPYLSVDIGPGGDYRYDESTMDLFDVAKEHDEELLRQGYTVDAFIPSFDAEDLDSAGSAPAGVLEDMTALPDDMPEQITQIASRVIGEHRTDYQKVAALQQWFRRSGGFRYSLWDGPATSGMAGLVGFLTTDRVGYCEQFATAMAVMTRSLGIPSRVVAGFGRPESNPTDRTYVFTGKNLHAWTEVYFEGYGWVVFDPTPAVQSGPAPAYSRGIEEEDVTATDPSETPSAQPAPTRPDQASDASNAETDGGMPTWPWVVLGVLLLVSATPRLLRARQRRRRLGVLKAGSAEPDVLVDAAWQELRATTRDHRLLWTQDRSPRTTLAGLQRQLDLDPTQAARVSALSRTFERARYARTPSLSANEREELLADTTMLLTEIRTAVTPTDRRRARWWPASLRKN